MLSLLVPGKYKVKNMDVYLEPLIEELEEVIMEGCTSGGHFTPIVNTVFSCESDFDVDHA